MCFYFGKNALSALAFLSVFQKFAWQQTELCVFRGAASAAPFFIKQKSAHISATGGYVGGLYDFKG